MTENTYDPSPSQFHSALVTAFNCRNQSEAHKTDAGRKHLKKQQRKTELRRFSITTRTTPFVRAEPLPNHPNKANNLYCTKTEAAREDHVDSGL
jgi:hypothetical protein